VWPMCVCVFIVCPMVTVHYVRFACCYLGSSLPGWFSLPCRLFIGTSKKKKAFYAAYRTPTLRFSTAFAFVGSTGSFGYTHHIVNFVTFVDVRRDYTLTANAPFVVDALHPHQ